MNRMYSVLTVKAVEEDQRIIRGTATTPSPDRVGDVVEPLGVQFSNPMPLLWQHQHDKPIGTVTFDKPTKSGITFEARLAQVEQPAGLKARVDEAWESVKAGLVRAVSIGFRAIEYSFIENGGIRFTETEAVELSLVTVPANADAVISTIKSIDTQIRAASGIKDGEDRPVPPGVTGTSTKKVHLLKPKEKTMAKTIAEQISAFQATRQAKSARMAEIMEKAAEEGATLDASQTEEYDTLAEEVKSIDAHLKRLEDLEKVNKSAATPVKDVKDDKSGADVRGGVRVEVKAASLPKGTSFTRYAMALARSKGNLMQVAEIAKGWHDSTPEVESVLKSAVAAGTTTDATWAKPLVEYQNMVSEFAELLRPATIIGKINGLRRVPFNVKIPRQTGGSTVGWVGEGKPKSVSALAFDQITLGLAKTAGIVVITDELARSSSPAAEEVVRNDLVAQTAQFLDIQFVDPNKAAVSNISPASITNGVTPTVASGTTADHFRADAKKLIAAYLAANMSTAGAVWIMPETMALSLAMMLNAFGQPEFPGLTAAGGTLLGLPVVTSQSVPANPGSGDPLTGDGDRLILAKADEILLADDGQTMLDVSTEASLQMDSAPDSPPTASTVLMSLWQNNMVGIRAERYINWAKRRAGAVQFIDSAKYG